MNFNIVTQVINLIHIYGEDVVIVLSTQNKQFKSLIVFCFPMAGLVFDMIL